MYWVYVIQLTNGKKYIGHTNNIERRYQEHLSGRSPYTRQSGVQKIIYVEEYETRSEAMKREKFLKTGRGREWLKHTLTEHSASGRGGFLVGAPDIKGLHRRMCEPFYRQSGRISRIDFIHPVLLHRLLENCF